MATTFHRAAIASNLKGSTVSWKNSGYTVIYTETMNVSSGADPSLYTRYVYSTTGTYLPIKPSGTAHVADTIELQTSSDFGTTYGAEYVEAGVLQGYTFNGWYSGVRKRWTYVPTDVELTNLITTNAKITRSQIQGSAGYILSSSTSYTEYYYVVVAVYERNPYFDITYNLNGGTSGSRTPTTVERDAEAYIDAPTRQGYTFEGWNVSSGLDASTAKYAIDETNWNSITSSTERFGDGYQWCKVINLNITAPGVGVTLNANWTANTYTVTFNPNGGTVTTSSKTVTYDGTYGELPIPTRERFNFVGWFTTSETTGGEQILETSTVSITNNQTLYARWEEKPICYVVFDSAGGNAPSEQVKALYDGDEFGSLPTCVWDESTSPAYTLVGWFTSASGGSRIYPSTIYRESMGFRVYAQWSSNSVTITFDPNGGFVAPTSADYVKGGYFGDLPVAIRSYNEAFDGWYTEQTGGEKITESSIVPSLPTTLYARFTRQKEFYTIRYIDQTGTNSYYATEVEVGVTVSLLGFEDLGWVVPSGYSVTVDRQWKDAAGNTYPDKASVIDLAQPGDEVTLMAIMTPIELTLTLNANGGSFDDGVMTVYRKKYGDVVGVLPNPKLNGKRFDGWYTAASGGTAVLATQKMTGSMTVYAHWGDPKIIAWITARVG